MDKKKRKMLEAAFIQTEPSAINTSPGFYIWAQAAAKLALNSLQCGWFPNGPETKQFFTTLLQLCNQHQIVVPLKVDFPTAQKQRSSSQRCYNYVTNIKLLCRWKYKAGIPKLSNPAGRIAHVLTFRGPDAMSRVSAMDGVVE